MFPFRDHNPAERTPYVTWGLIAANVLVFLITLVAMGNEQATWSLYEAYALFPAKLSAGEDPATLLTSAFLHGGFMHLAGNMLFLWIFGDNLEDQMGHGPFLLFYLASAAAAGLAQVATAPSSMVPMVGASGAIAGVMGGYLLLFPKAKVDVLLILIIYIRVFSLPAAIVLGIWFAIQIFSGLGADPDLGGVAYWAHAGGFAAGLVLALPLWLRRGGPDFWDRTGGHPPHPEAKGLTRRSPIPIVRKGR